MYDQAIGEVWVGQYGDVRWRGHLLTDQERMPNGKWRTCYTLKMCGNWLSPVQVQQRPKGWEVLLWGDPVGTFRTKSEAQHEALDAIGVRPWA